MTSQEAIDRLEAEFKLGCATCIHPQAVGYCENDCITKQATEEAIKALEKQIPKKPTFYGGNYYCPDCNDLVGCHILIMKWDNAFCKHCGQAIDWSDTE